MKKIFSIPSKQFYYVICFGTISDHHKESFSTFNYFLNLLGNVCLHNNADAEGIIENLTMLRKIRH